MSWPNSVLFSVWGRRGELGQVVDLGVGEAAFPEVRAFGLDCRGLAFHRILEVRELVHQVAVD
eukprot:8185887-Pyramimonas_sp.AAC.1